MSCTFHFYIWSYKRTVTRCPPRTGKREKKKDPWQDFEPRFFNLYLRQPRRHESPRGPQRYTTPYHHRAHHPSQHRFPRRSQPAPKERHSRPPSTPSQTPSRARCQSPGPSSAGSSVRRRRSATCGRLCGCARCSFSSRRKMTRRGRGLGGVLVGLKRRRRRREMMTK